MTELTDKFGPLCRWSPLREMFGEEPVVPESVDDDPVDGQVIRFAHFGRFALVGSGHDGGGRS